MVLPVVEVKITADPTSAKKGLKDVSAAILAADKATDIYAKGLKELSRAERSGLLSARALSRGIDQLESEYLSASRAAAKLGGGTAAMVRPAQQAATSVKKLGNLSRNARFQIQNTAFQLQDMAVQLEMGTSASRVMSQQLPQLLGGFGAVGAVLGVLAGVGIPALAFAFGDLSDEIDATDVALDSFGSTDLGSIRGSISGLVSIQESYTDAVEAGGAASSPAAALVVANSEAEFNARKRVLDIETQLLAIRGQEQRESLRNLQDQQTQRRQNALDVASTLGQGATGAGSGGLGVPQPRFDVEAFGKTLDGRLGELGENRLVIEKITAELELLGLAEEEARAVLNTEFGEISTVDSDGGGGGKGAGKLSTLLDSLKTERTLLDEWRAEGLERLKTAGEAELEALGGINAAKLLLEQEYQEKLAVIRQKEQDSTLSGYGTLFGNLASTFSSGSGKLLKISKAFSVAQGAINSYRAYTEVLADPALIGQPFLRTALAASTLASGLAQVANIKSVSTSGGGGGGAGAGAAAAPVAAQSPLNVRLSGLGAGDSITGSQLSGLFDRLQDEAGDRGLQVSFAT